MITITTTAEAMEINTGALYPDNIAFQRAFWRKDQIHYVMLNSNHVEVDASDGNSWLLTLDGAGLTMPISLIDGVAPVSLEDLYTKVMGLLI